MFQARGDGFEVLLLFLDQPKAAQYAKAWCVERDSVAAERLLHNPGHNVIVGGLIPGQLLGRLFQGLLVKRFEVERESRFKNLLQEADDTLSADLGFRQVFQAFFQLAQRADSDFVPVEESPAQISERLV